MTPRTVKFVLLLLVLVCCFLPTSHSQQTSSVEERVNSLLAKTQTRSFDAIAGRLPAETQMYVPKCEATLKKREGLTLADL